MNLPKVSILSISKRALLFEAALIWSFAGGMLLMKGFSLLKASSGLLWYKIIGCLICGIIFYILIFSKISRSHINRIAKLPGDHHWFYEFFNLKSYLMMTGMILLGVFLRKTATIPLTSLSLLYTAMGIPLLLSSVRFYHSWFCFLAQINSPII